MIVVATSESADDVVWTSPHGDELTYEYWMRTCKMEQVRTRLGDALFWVQDARWQETRLSMKGKTTHEKIKTLEDWLDRNDHNEAATVQVDNYLNALRRGGQLPPKGWTPYE